MNISTGSLCVRFVVLILLAIGITSGCYTYRYYEIYESIHVSTVGSAAIEYGSAKNDILELLDEVDGEVVSIKSELDTKKVGIQEVVVEVEKDCVVKEIPIEIEIKDTIAPKIELKEQTVSLEVGDSFNIFDNLVSVYDVVDGDLSYQLEVDSTLESGYYMISDSVDTFSSGTYPITIQAVDKSGNVTTVHYDVVVKEKSIPIITNRVFNDSYVSSVNTDSIISIALSLVGSPYASGGNTPAGFDCSGFVQYVYAQAGITVSRSSSTQIYDGVGVSYENAHPGDILSWGYVDGSPTHSAIYIGNGQMIHATNPRQGVIISDVAAWTRGSGTHVIAVRRI